MVCIYCGSATKVINSRRQKRINQVWRRRQCINCSMVATSHEALDLSTSLTVRRQDGSLSPFNRDLLLISLYEACKHRTDSVQVASALLQTVIANLTAQHVMHATVDRNSIITCAHDVLKRLDTSAAAVYQAYHKQSS